MRILVDTNLLTRAAQPKHPQHQLATRAVSTLGFRHHTLCLAPQNLYEFWVVATRPIGENGLGMRVELALARLNDLKAAVKGKAAHDARLVAAMTVHALATILTFNKQHFVRYSGITVLTPEEALAANL